MEEAQRLDDEPMISKMYSACSFRRLQDMVPARAVLYFLSFSGFLVSFMMRTDINIAMIAMARLPPPSPYAANASSTPMYCYDPANMTDELAADNITKEEGEFDWDATTQSTILGSFYWCYILSQVVGGILTQHFGTKTVFGFSQFITAICSLLIPTAAPLHYGAVIALRSIQGIASGLTWPAMYAMVGHWIPAIERSRFMSSFQGFSFGIGLTYPLCGFLIAHFGWRVVFYVTGSVGILWCLIWWLLAFDTPAQHPRITPSERRYIESNVGNTVVGEKGLVVPWHSILTSLPAWSIGITTFGRIWIHYTFIIPGPMYMKTVLGFSIQKNGLMSGAPFLCSYVSSVLFCYLADVLVNNKLLTLTNVRKLFTAMSQIVPGLLVLAIGYLGCNITLVLIAWFCAVTLITASYAGAMASVVDIAPNLAGPILAFAQTIHMTASFLSPIAAGILLQESQTLEQWQQVFWLAAVISCGTYIFFQVFGTADIQVWNYPNQKIPVDLIQPLQPANCKQNGTAFKENGEAAED
ncbi:Sialin [Cryptotermes secundus]|uniref:Sialin n=1 Tax=Cryptotermes secundus TaxID=105785 RepID=A0A2J7RH19_9NEOP|nr:sialin isoform X1 [Cryptotermes secundus]XP_023727990.1 sialin isoform X1 [Cryptotermes secundus]XP_023727991.1 sialin isoform X1 [Cryptotermes secundus]XP_023727992.1 sialin isoform X1 [Cryptotermes secundus]XP_033606083.1 sialin isoform X1 [Cryptotermes secundus]PNF40129.1 Sialin [Cryptotermes secundus]